MRRGEPGAGTSDDDVVSDDNAYDISEEEEDSLE